MDLHLLLDKFYYLPAYRKILASDIYHHEWTQPAYSVSIYSVECSRH